MISKIIKKLKKIHGHIQSEREKNIYKPLYKLVEIREADKEYTVTVKVINKNITFDAKPEEVLANDILVDQFSPRDIRTLTYLGYLGINQPKYQILAKRLSQNEKITFVLQKKGERKVIIKTADEIINEADIIPNLNSEDAKTIGYTVALESAANEKLQKLALQNEKCMDRKISSGITDASLD